MFIPIILIPIAAEHQATLGGVVWRVIPCEYCHQRDAFPMKLEATGTSVESAERAQERAMEYFHNKVQNVVVAIPCPNCGAYQSNMIEKLRDDLSINRLQIIGAVFFVLSFAFLVLGIQYDWLFTSVFALVGLTILAAGYRQAFCLDPNAGDPEPRKAIVRQLAISGDQLDELLAQSNPSGPTPHMN